MSKKKGKKDKPRRGRPPLPAGEVRDDWIEIRVSGTEKQQIESNAEKAGQAVGPWARERLLKPENG